MNTLDNLARMQVLASLDLDNPALRRELDAITERTASRLGLPISMVSFVLDTAQLLGGAHGIGGWVAAAQGTPVEWSFCANAVASGQPYIVPDATVDAQQASNPLVTIDGIRSYAGVPLILDGQILGAHCIMGTDTHTFTDAELAELRDSADEITALLQNYRLPVT
jgi:GAF domain-containing protein